MTITMYHTITLSFTLTRTLVHHDREEATSASKKDDPRPETSRTQSLGRISCTNRFPLDAVREVGQLCVCLVVVWGNLEV